MDKKKKIGVNRQIARYFEDHQEVSLEEIEQIILESQSQISLIDSLYSFIHFSINRYSNYPNLEYVYKTSVFISKAMEKNPDNKSIDHQRKRVLCKLEKLRLEHQEFLANHPKEKEWLGKTKYQLNRLSKMDLSKISKKDAYNYQLLEFIITEIKDVQYLENILSRVPSFVNSKNEEGVLLFDHISLLVMEKIASNTFKKEELSYYLHVLDLMKNNSHFKSSKNKDVLKTLQKRIKKANKNQTSALLQLKNLLLDEAYIDGMIPFNYNINIDFSKTLIDELELYQTSISKQNYPDRVVLDDYIITIDGLDAVEIDDALSVKRLKNGNILLGVHIATPLGYLPFSSLNIKEAIKRGSTIYLPKEMKVDKGNSKFSFIPIFQEKFSTNQASLQENKPRLATSYFFEFDPYGYMVNQKYLKTIIKNRYRSSYDEINHVLEFGSTNKKLQKTVHMLDDLTYLLEDRLKLKSMYLEKKKEKFNPAQLILGSSRAERIISTMMMLTGKNVAEFFAHSKEGYPTLYRVHKINEDIYLKIQRELRQMQSINNQGKIYSLYQKILAIYPSATYDIKGSHYGLNLDHYCHCTSPLRRSADLIVEHSLDVCYFNHPTDKEIGVLEKTILSAKDVINQKNHDIDLFLNDYQKSLKKTKNVK